MKVCIVSDSHDHIPLLDAAVAEAKKLGAEAVLHAGDVVAPSTLHCLRKHELPVHVIHGNNTGDLWALGRLASKPDSIFHYHGMDAGIELAEKRIFIVHYPHYAHAMASTGDWDLVICGHSHVVSIEEKKTCSGGKAWLINPGTTGGVGKSKATWILADLETMDFEVHEIDKAIEHQQQEFA